MARGVIIGQVFDLNGAPLTGAQAGLSAIRGANVNGVLLKFSVPPVTIEVGSSPKTKISTDRRLLNDSGVFVIPFEWDSADADNFARVAGTLTLEVKVTVLTDQENKSYEGTGVKVLDAVQFMENIKAGQLAGSGDLGEVLETLKGDLLAAIKGDEFKGIPFSMLSTDQIAILAILPRLSF